MMQELGFSLQVCNCLHNKNVCMHVQGSLSPRGTFACSSRCFMSFRCSRGLVPSSSLLLLSSPFTSICSSRPCWWHLRPRGITEESGHVTNWLSLRAADAREITAPYLFQLPIHEKVEWGEKGRLVIRHLYKWFFPLYLFAQQCTA